ncbi:MAG: phage tail tube protein [Glycocaulis sp.]
MTLKSAARGRASSLFVKSKEALAASVSGDFQRLTFYREGIARSNDLAEDNELGVALDNDRDATDPGPGLPTASGTVEVPADLNQLWFWLYHFFGEPVTAEDDGVFTHVFTSGAADLPFFDAEIPLGGDRYKYVPGAAVNEWNFGVAKEEGYRRFTFALLGRDAVIGNTSAAGTPEALPARAKIPASKGLVRINSSIAASLVAGDFTASNNFEAVPLADDSALISRMDPGDTSLTGQPRFRFNRAAAANAALAVFDDEKTPFALEVEYALSATASLLIALPRCFGQRVTPLIEGPGPVEFTASLSARQSAGAPLMTVTLKNAIEDLL